MNKAVIHLRSILHDFFTVSLSNTPKIEPTVFSMTEYAAMVGKIQDEVSTFRERQLKAMNTVGER